MKRIRTGAGVLALGLTIADTASATLITIGDGNA